LPLTYQNANGFYNVAASVNIGSNMKLSFTINSVLLYGGVSNTTASIPSPTDFTNLFDYYRIDWVELITTHACQANSANVNVSGAGVTCNPNYYIAYDSTDNFVAPTLNDVQQAAGTVLWRPNGGGEIFKKRFYPRLSSTVGNSGSTTNQFLEVPKNAWVNSSSTTAAYGGILIGTDSFSQLGSTFTPVQLNFRYGISCKGMK